MTEHTGNAETRLRNELIGAQQIIAALVMREGGDVSVSDGELLRVEGTLVTAYDPIDHTTHIQVVVYDPQTPDEPART